MRKTSWRLFDENSAVIGTIVVGTLLGMTISRFVIKINNYLDFEKQAMLIGGAIGLIFRLFRLYVFGKMQEIPGRRCQTTPVNENLSDSCCISICCSFTLN